MRHPMQPIIRAEDDVIRFQENAIIRWLCDSGRLNLNDIATLPFDNEDRMQLAQLLGYSVSGFGDLSYADPNVVAAADAVAEALLDR
jgi:hypothetical protein